MNIHQVQAPSVLPLATHNGEIRVNHSNGKAEIFRARTVQDVRVVERRLGKKKWIPFGKLEERQLNDQTVLQVVPSSWRARDKESQIRANILNYPAMGRGAGLTYTFVGKCRRCNRALTDSVSAASGIGPICAEKEIANAARLAGVRSITPASPASPPPPAPSAPIVPTFTFAELAAKLSDDELAQAYEDAVAHHNATVDDESNSDELCTQTGHAAKLIWEQMSGRPGLHTYYQSAEANHNDLEELDAAPVATPVATTTALCGKEKAAYKAATHAVYRAPEGDYLVSSETSELFHCIDADGHGCSCKGFKFHGKCWHLESVAILRRATLKVTRTIEDGGQKALESLVEHARQQAAKATIYQHYCYMALVNLAETLHDPFAGDFSQQRVIA